MGSSLRLTFIEFLADGSKALAHGEPVKFGRQTAKGMEQGAKTAKPILNL
jgi:acyl-coenzyme A thioesterase PaaI-like protein